MNALTALRNQYRRMVAKVRAKNLPVPEFKAVIQRARSRQCGGQVLPAPGPGGNLRRYRCASCHTRMKRMPEGGVHK